MDFEEIRAKCVETKIKHALLSVQITITGHHDHPYAYIGVGNLLKPPGSSYFNTHSCIINGVKGGTLEDLFICIDEEIPKEWDKIRKIVVEAMTIEIIRLVDASGSITHAALRQAGFNQQHIDMFSSEAITEANIKASYAPYIVLEDINKENGAPIELVQPPYVPDSSSSPVDDEIPF